MLFFSIGPGMFFRPEENAFLSKGLDNVGFLPAAEIHSGDKDDRTAILVRTAAMHIAVDFQLHRFFTVGAFRLDPN
jgi:hypothetical protein